MKALSTDKRALRQFIDDVREAVGLGPLYRAEVATVLVELDSPVARQWHDPQPPFPVAERAERGYFGGQRARDPGVVQRQAKAMSRRRAFRGL